MENPRYCRRGLYLHLGIVLAAALAARVVLAALFPPLIADDSASYLQLGRMLADLDFSRYNGARTPLYPLLILTLGFETARVVLFQHLLGLIAAGLVYLLFLDLTANRKLALIAGLIAALNPGMIVIERALLSESLAATLLVCTAVLFFSSLKRGATANSGLLAAGLMAGLCVLTRPSFAYLPPLLGVLALWTGGRAPVGRRLRRAALAALPGVLMLLMWSGFNYRQLGFFSPATTTGISLMNHAGAFIEDAPPEYELIRDIYLKHRARRIEEVGHQRMTIFRAYPELMQATGLDYTGLSRELTKLALVLIMRNPLKYTKSVAVSFVRFWRAAWYATQGGIAAAIKNGSLPMKLLVGGFVLIHLLFTAGFLLLPVMVLFRPLIREKLCLDYRWLALYAIVFGGALLQALAEAGENPRYGIPYEPLILPAGAMALVVFYNVIHLKPVREDAGTT